MTLCDSDYGTTAGSCPTEDYPLCSSTTGKCYKDESTCFLSQPWFDIHTWGNVMSIHLHWDGSNNDCTGSVELQAQSGRGQGELPSFALDFQHYVL